MGKRLDCKDLGFDCGFEVKADNDEQIIQAAGVHAREAHGLEVTPELASLVAGAIRSA